MSFDEFCADSRTVDAVVRNLEIIGEAFTGIPEEKKFLKAQVDWIAIKGLRNRNMEPAKLSRSGSGLPMPSKASCRQAWISWLMRCSCLRSWPCQSK